MGIFRLTKAVLLGVSVTTGLLTGNTFAYPYNPMPKTINNGDDSVTIHTIGDEHYHYSQTSDGILVVQSANGIYYYADKDGNASKFKAKNAEKRSADEKKFLNKLNKDSVRKAHKKNNPDKYPIPKGERQKRANWVPTGDGSSSDSNHPPMLRMPNPATHSSGTNKFPMILVTTSGLSSIDSLGFYNLLNQTDYNTDGYTGSARDYFSDQSSGKFIPAFDVFVVTLNNSISQYTTNDYNLAVDAINAAISKYGSRLKGSDYDSDGDGKVDAVGILYAGAEISGVGGYQYHLEWNGVTLPRSYDGKTFDNYFLVAQANGFPVILHEFSHTMGLMDHYCVGYGSSDCYGDYTNSNYQAPGAHAWDVMATGMYSNGGKTPVGYSAFERNFMGWTDYTTLSASSNVTTIAPLHSANVAYKIPVNGNNDEWYILENRQATRWDAGLPSHGLLIWHIDYDENAWNSDIMNDEAPHQRVDVVEAGNLKVNNYYDGFEFTHTKDDVFPGSQNVTSYGPFKSWAGTDLGVQLYNITESNNNVCFATQSGVNVNGCLATSSSSVASSSSVKSSNSSTMSSNSVQISSSSSAQPVFSSSAQITSSNSQTQVVESTVTYNVELPLSTIYAAVNLDLSQVASLLGISASNAQSLYESGELKYHAVTAAGAIDKTPSTAEAPGHWFNRSGAVCDWGANAFVYSNLQLSSMTTNIGNYESGISIGQSATIAQALEYNGKRIVFKMMVTVTSAISDSSVVISDRSLHISPMDHSAMTVNVFDMLGNRLMTKKVDSFDQYVDLSQFVGKVLLVRITEGHKLIVRQQVTVR